MATYWENSCSFGLQNVSLVSVPDCWFSFSHLCFCSGNFFLIAPFPDFCLRVPSHRYHLDDPVFVFRGVRREFYFFIPFFDENFLSKQNSPRWDAAFCGVTSGAMLFAYVP